LHLYVVPGLPCQHKKESAEGAAVTFSERVNDIKLDHVFSGAHREIFGVQPTQVVF